MEKALTRIRKFKIEDINNILEIEEQAFPKTTFTKKTLLNLASIFPDTFIIIEVGQDIVGYIIFDLNGHIYSTVVNPNYRRKGYGKMLCRYALKYAKKSLWLEVRSKNTGAIRFYRRLGMEITGKIPNYYGNDDALIMVLRQKNRPDGHI